MPGEIPALASGAALDVVAPVSARWCHLGVRARQTIVRGKSRVRDDRQDKARKHRRYEKQNSVRHFAPLHVSRAFPIERNRTTPGVVIGACPDRKTGPHFRSGTRDEVALGPMRMGRQFGAPAASFMCHAAYAELLRRPQVRQDCAARLLRDGLFPDASWRIEDIILSKTPLTDARFCRVPD